MTVLAISTTDGTVILGALLIVATVVIVVIGMGKDQDTQKSVFTLAGVMIGLLAGGTIGTLSGTRAADNAAEQVKTDVQDTVNKIQP